VKSSLALALLALAGCAQVVTRPAASEGARVYVVGALSFEAPSDWRASGDERHVRLLAPALDGTIEASAVSEVRAGPDCLARAEAALERGTPGLTAVQRHASSFAGFKAVAEEADQGSWHGWAWATCTAGAQYRVWFAGRSPLSRELLSVQQRLLASARLEAVP
jgi:uncharacterized protein YceK